MTSLKVLTPLSTQLPLSDLFGVLGINRLLHGTKSVWDLLSRNVWVSERNQTTTDLHLYLALLPFLLSTRFLPPPPPSPTPSSLWNTRRLMSP